MQPTKEQIAAYQKAFDHFNRALFGGALPFAYLNFSRHDGSLGFFAPNRWSGKGSDTLHEISLNPDMLLKDPREYYSTLVHEMAHLWQQCFGEPSRNGYHNKEWADKMDAIGLVPSNTGGPGGRRTGQRMTHYIEAGGPYESAFQNLPAGAVLPYVSGRGAKAEKEPAKPRERKHKYHCPACGIEIWAVSEELQVACMNGCLGVYFVLGDQAV